ncbi:MAG: alanine racemase [Candidatus Stygibacter australis]|nr:alanine racemase [Candidatus Stygibacter australis]
MNSTNDSRLTTHDFRSWVEIDLSAFQHNFKALAERISPQTKIMQIIKADAYGHGALEIARTALDCGADFLGVANADEGALLRYYGIKADILILSPSLLSEIPFILENYLMPTISDPKFALAYNELASKNYPVHLNIDTGMGRSGAELSQAAGLYKLCKSLPNINIQGIFTHFAAAENDNEYSQYQIRQFQKFLDSLSGLPEFIHSANSSAILNISECPGNLVRFGALTYGFYTDNSQRDIIDLQPVLKFKSRISQIKTARKGDYIGYNLTYKCEHDLKYAIIPVGYADGYDYLLSNRGKVLHKDAILPVIGKVSMDMIAVDISSALNAKAGDEITLLGSDPHLRVEDVSALYKGSPYELLCQTGRRAPRFFYENDKLISTAPLLRREFVSSDYNDDKLNRIIEAAMQQRMQGSQIADFVYQDILKNIFSDQDNNVHFRHDFQHSIDFSISDDPAKQNYWLTRTSLSFRKILSADSFRIACANNEDNLNKYFLEPDVEYRWLLDESLALSPDSFQLSSARINDIELYSSARIVNNCLEITCYHEKLKELIDQEVTFEIKTLTWYPRSFHQLTVYITGITHKLDLEFTYPPDLHMENIIPILAGKNKFPQLVQTPTSTSLSSPHWLFPSSGIIFVYYLTSDTDR